MTNELGIWCEKYKFNDDIKKYVGDIEKDYKQAMELQKDKSKEEQPTMSEWIYKKTNIEELKCFSERDKFIYGLGILSNKLEIFVTMLGLI